MSALSNIYIIKQPAIRFQSDHATDDTQRHIISKLYIANPVCLLHHTENLK